MKNTMYPITNDMTLELVEKQLKSANQGYAVIFNLMLETGIPLSSCVELKCCDIDKNAITFHPTHKYITRTEPISSELQKEIAEYLNGRNDESYAFSQKSDPTKHIHYRAFLGVLETICKNNGISPTITSQTIRKTYIYRLFVEGDNTEKIYALTNCRSIRAIYEYLGLPIPELSDKEYHSKESVRDVIVHERLIEKTKERTEETFTKIADNINYTSQTSYEYCREVMKLLTLINEALTYFDDFEKNQDHIKSGSLGTKE